MELLSPAKINLNLRVLFRREDGYHEISSLFQAVSLHDTLDISLAEEESFTCSDTTLPVDQNNLIMKACALFRKKSGIHFAARIHLEKNIPIEAGLGGGSSNAATTLFGLNALHHFIIPEKELMAWGAEIGSDVAFFFSRGTAYCHGRGERVENAPTPLLDKKIWLVKVKEGLSSPLVYKSLKIKSHKHEDLKRLYINDLEESALCQLPTLGELKRRLHAQGFEAVFLTGSGSGLICVGEDIPAVTFPTRCYPLFFLQREENEWYRK